MWKPAGLGLVNSSYREAGLGKWSTESTFGEKAGAERHGWLGSGGEKCGKVWIMGCGNVRKSRKYIMPGLYHSAPIFPLPL